ncbi:MAG TPA: protein kinase [Terracidiphilus sp.]|nr:protein kinase [Terracidiphilus sp.]
MPATTPPDAASAPSASTQQIGHYQVVAKIGEGGMGEVYRARDTRLNREVAIKVLPRAFAEDPYRMARFEREAQLLASLNHPKIAAIYGLEESGATRALVMELVEGPTLAERIGRAPASARAKASVSPAQPAEGASGTNTSGPGGTVGHTRKAAIPMDEALPIAQQVAEALEYAHEHGVVHRDLKPANIKVTSEGDVKVLDFGLAKAMGPADASGDLANSPTLSLAMTEAGLIIGTAAYMAPEQAKGKPVDRRADIWAFGCVLYQMLTGKKAFDGETVSDVLAAVIKSEPDWNALPADTPPAMQRLVRRCLQKDPHERLRDIGDARIAIEETLSGAEQEAAISGGPIAQSQPSSRLRGSLPGALGAAAFVFAGVAAWLLLRPAPPQSLYRFSISPPENGEFENGGEMSISPDGRYFAFVARAGADKPPTVWLRPLDSLTAHPVPGTEGASLPFWSPDSQQIGFHANGKLEKVAVSGGLPEILCTASRPGASWNREDMILYSDRGSLYRVPDTGGTPTLVATPVAAQNETAFDYPQFLPDGRHFVVFVYTNASTPTFIGAGSLDSKNVERLTQSTTNALYAPPGYLFYMQENALMARPFSARTLRFGGPAVPVAQNVGEFAGPQYGFFTVAPAGLLAYQIAPAATTNQMTWFNRAGQKMGTVGNVAIYSNMALSPEGDRLAVGVGEHGKANIWVYDLKRGTVSRLTFNAAYDVNPAWSMDGSKVFFSSNRSGAWGIYQKAADGLGTTQTVSQSGTQNKALDDMAADGRYAIYDTATNPSLVQLWVLPLFGDRKPFPFVKGNFGAASAQFSPNGRFVAYNSTETGRTEVYVQTFPQHTGRWEISTSGGLQPMWRRDGKELFYLTPDEKLMAVDVDTTSGTFKAGIPRELFQAQLVPTSYWRNIYLPSPDGQRFLMLTPASENKPEPITFLVNWPALLKK